MGSPPAAFSWSPSGRFLSAVSVGNGVGTLIESSKGTHLWQAPLVTSLQFSGDERTVLIDGRLQDTKTGQLLPSPRLPFQPFLSSRLAFGSDGALSVGVDFGRGTEVCRISRQSDVICTWSHGMSTFALTEPPIFCRDLRYDDGERRYECHAEDGVVRPYSDNSLPRDPVGRVFSDISRQVVENSNGVFWCDGAGNDVAKITDEHCDIVAAASTKPMVPTATRDQGPSTEDSQNRRSTIRVYDLSRDVPNHIQELVIPEPSGVALTADGSGWVASTRQGLLWVSVRDSSSAVIQLFPDGIVVHWVDGTVNVSAGVRPWIMCHSGASALPVEACRGQSSAQGKHHSSW